MNGGRIVILIRRGLKIHTKANCNSGKLILKFYAHVSIYILNMSRSFTAISWPYERNKTSLMKA